MAKTNKKYVLQAEGMMRVAREIPGKEEHRPFLTQQYKVAVLGKLDCRLVLHAMQRPFQQYAAAKSLVGICYDFCSELQANAGTAGLVHPLPKEWAPTTSPQAARTSKATNVPIIPLSRQAGGIDTDDTMIEVVQSKGSKVGMTVATKDKQEFATIETISLKHVGLLWTNGASTNVPVAKFIEKYFKNEIKQDCV